MSRSTFKLYNNGGLLKDRYQKVKDITEGAYGLVSLAKDVSKNNRLVAVKYIFQLDELDDIKKNYQLKLEKSNKLSTKSTIDRMTNGVCPEALYEIDIHLKIGIHKNIVSIYDYFDSFIILEYCSNGDLYEAIKSNCGPKTTRDIVNVTLQLIEAIQFVHSKSIYHRDIKPENILIADDWTIKLSDWGLATTNKICTDFGVGSERYMAPELFDEKNISSYDASKCDIWSIGICLLNIVFHKNPFSVANQTDKSFTYFACNREALFDIFSTMSHDLFKVLRFSLTIDPENRDLNKMRDELLKVQNVTIEEYLEDYFANVNDITDEKHIANNNISHSKKENITNSKVNTSEVAPIKIKNAGNNRRKKSFAIPTPNTHINNHFHDFKQKQYNRKDFFTPPSTNYMDKRFNNNQNNTMLLSATNTSSSSKNTPKTRKNSFGKYIPPNLRSPLHIRAGSHENNLDLEDEMFILEEDNEDVFDDDNHENGNSPPILFDDDLDSLSNEINNNLGLSEKTYSSGNSSVPSLVASIPLHSGSTTGRKRVSMKSGRESNKSSSSSSSQELGTSVPKKYVPPHQRENWNFISKYHQQQQQQQRRFTNHHNTRPNFKTHQNNNHEFISNSVPTIKSDWFQPAKIRNYEDTFDDDYDHNEIYS